MGSIAENSPLLRKIKSLYYACFYAVNALLQTNVNSFKLWSLGFEPAVGLSEIEDERDYS